MAERQVIVKVVSGRFELSAEVHSGESVVVIPVLLPGSEADVDIRLDLVEAGADAQVYALTLAGDGDKFRICTSVNHLCGGATSNQIVKNIASDGADVDFRGRIKVEHGAAGTEAFQQCHSLLLGDGAIVSTSPELEIYADDVKCSHGATVGKIDEDELFYLRSRGIPLDEAKELLVKSFLMEIVEKIEDSAVREEIEGRLAAEM